MKNTVENSQANFRSVSFILAFTLSFLSPLSFSATEKIPKDPQCQEYHFKMREGNLPYIPPKGFSEGSMAKFSKLMRLGVKDDILPALQLAHELSQHSPSEHEKLLAKSYIGLFYHRLGNIKAVIEHNKPVLAKLEELPAYMQESVLSVASSSYFRLGDYDKALTLQLKNIANFGANPRLEDHIIPFSAIATGNYLAAACALTFNLNNYKMSRWSINEKIYLPLYLSFTKLGNLERQKLVLAKIKENDRTLRREKNHFEHDNLIKQAQVAVNKKLGQNQNQPVAASSETGKIPVREKVLPEYPEEALPFPMDLRVDVKFSIASDGTVDNVVDPKYFVGDARFVAAAKKALTEWKFQVEGYENELPINVSSVGFQFYNDENGQHGVKVLNQ